MAACNQVENVLLLRPRRGIVGTMILGPTTLDFRPDSFGHGEKVTSVPLSMVSGVSKLAIGTTPQVQIDVCSRNFVYSRYVLQNELEASAFYEALNAAIHIEVKDNLPAFVFPPAQLCLETADESSWVLYRAEAELTRQLAAAGMAPFDSPASSWRITTMNGAYTLCPTYPATLVVPARVSDAVLRYAARHRSKGRIPALTYVHRTGAALVRCSQPLAGLAQNRSIQDERAVEAIFEMPLKDGMISTNVIMDARPSTNAYVNAARGAGSERLGFYRNCRKEYLGIDNIHVMRDSLSALVDIVQTYALETTSAAVRNGTATPPQAGYTANRLSFGDGIGTGVEVGVGQESPAAPGGGSRSNETLDDAALDRTNWLWHIQMLLDGTSLIADALTGSGNSKVGHVLLHCSDGWDRTAQLAALVQVCLDPYCRTTRGFLILIEKDWIAFGHKFGDRCGHLSTDYYSRGQGATGATGAIRQVQNRIKQSVAQRETSPIFHQFLECVYQLLATYPSAFEFSDKLLADLFYHAYSCQYGTFLFNCESERAENKLRTRTCPLWPEILGPTGMGAACYGNPLWQKPNAASADDCHATEATESETNHRMNHDTTVLCARLPVFRYWKRLLNLPADVDIGDVYRKPNRLIPDNVENGDGSRRLQEGAGSPRSGAQHVDAPGFLMATGSSVVDRLSQLWSRFTVVPGGDETPHNGAFAGVASPSLASPKRSF